MSYSEGHLARPRQPVLPSLSNRTLHHPSFLPLYMAAGFGHHHRDCNNQTVHPIIPAEFFYTDPTVGCGRRIRNIVTDLRVLDCFQLNTPSPVMSTCPAPPHRPDPFRYGPHPTRELGSSTWRMPTDHRVQPNHVVLQLTQEEDQAITTLLKLHHQSPLLSAETFSAAQIDSSSVVQPPQDLNVHPRPADSTSAEEGCKHLCSDVQYPRGVKQGEGWSDTELEAANTLLSRFILTEEDRICVQTHNKSAETLPDPLPYKHHEDPSVRTETKCGSEALPALITADSTQNDTGYFSFSSARQNEDPGWEDFRSAEDRIVSGDVSAVKGRTLSDSEGDAVHVLLSLSDMGTVDIMQ